MKNRSEKERRFDEIYNNYANDVYRVCLYFTRDKAEAQKIAEQTFIEFYDEFEEINPEYWSAHLICKARDLAKFNPRRRITK